MSDIRYARTARMLDDPDLGGDLLLVGLTYARFLDFGLPPGKKLSTNIVANCAFPGNRERHRKVKRLHEKDARTYQPPQPDWDGQCEAPMIRRAGPCGQHATGHGYLTDWETGEQEGIWSCNRHHAWRMDLIRRNKAAEPERRPIPPANHGGVLARHIPEFAWPKIWAWATDGRWVEHPESEPWKPPTLTLHLGDGAASGLSARPMLVPVEAS
jgi:hypothetical protein